MNIKVLSLIFFVTYGHTQEKCDKYKDYYDNVSNLMRIDSYTYFNNKIVEEIINSKVSNTKKK